MKTIAWTRTIRFTSWKVRTAFACISFHASSLDRSLLQPQRGVLVTLGMSW
ncbi:unnamed protein product [Ectocarpus sp. CCAP 1310/34]|nr:unnamed protein product [Ectocarpus sp. CCAP 1310/34]